MGVNEAVTPVSQIQITGMSTCDICQADLLKKLPSTGIAGCVGTLQALIRRADEGGSYGIDVSIQHSRFIFLTR